MRLVTSRLEFYFRTTIFIAVQQQSGYSDMHRCLEIPEIVDMICAELDPSYSWSFSSHNLANLARTCTSLFGPALPYLWASSTLSRILISCMPSDLWADDITKGSGPLAKKKHQIRQLRPIHESDWGRVKFYGRLVKQLSSGADHWSLSSAFPALSASSPEGLFPSLQTLHWYHSKDDFRFIDLFLYPTVTKILVRASSDANSSFFSTLATKCPKLIEFSLAPTGYANSEPAVSEFVRSLQCVQKISVLSLDQRALDHLSGLTTLNELMLSSLPEVLTLRPIHQSPTFSALRRLALHYPSIRSTTQFLGWCSRVSLVEFKTWLREAVLGKWTAFLPPFQRLFSIPLSNLSIDGDYDGLEGSDPNIHVITLQSMRRIFAFINLTKLVITSLVGFDLDNDAVAELARAWPQIVTLTLAVCFPRHAPRATLSCLQSFAQHCPHLCTLTMVLDARVAPGTDVGPRTHFVQHTLTTIRVDHSPLTDPVYAARFLSGVFPKLVEVQTQREYYANDEEQEQEHGDAIRLHRLWKGVERLLPELSAIHGERRMLIQAPSTS
ncbi:F-box domain-containing protein [Mycena sanguinolenta]|uniref:F-box domain-containing protein n=1 Tax=Mycena sanguinolenta TaxID=230812 RepID=A0A8H7CA50_9AGAR|nr:F-box domain-containing protein [Mycena sanguinolenta]